jgi:hypothetical protein
MSSHGQSGEQNLIPGSSEPASWFSGLRPAVGQHSPEVPNCAASAGGRLKDQANNPAIGPRRQCSGQSFSVQREQAAPCLLG